MLTKAKMVDAIRIIVNDLMMADYDDFRLPPPVAKAVRELMDLLPAIKEDDDEGK